MIYSFRDENYFSISQCYDRTFIPNHLMPEIHKHGGFEIMYIVNGNVSVEFFDGESNALDEVYHLFPGDFIFLDSARFHRLRVSETGARIVNIEVSPTREPRHPGQRSLGRMVAYDEKLRDFFRQNPGTFRLYDDSDLFNTLFLLVRRYFAEARDEAAQPAVRVAERRCRAVSEKSAQLPRARLHQEGDIPHRKLSGQHYARRAGPGGGGKPRVPAQTVQNVL